MYLHYQILISNIPWLGFSPSWPQSTISPWRDQLKKFLVLAPRVQAFNDKEKNTIASLQSVSVVSVTGPSLASIDFFPANSVVCSNVSEFFEDIEFNVFKRVDFPQFLNEISWQFFPTWNQVFLWTDCYVLDLNQSFVFLGDPILWLYVMALIPFCKAFRVLKKTSGEYLRLPLLLCGEREFFTRLYQITMFFHVFRPFQSRACNCLSRFFAVGGKLNQALQRLFLEHLCGLTVSFVDGFSQGACPTYIDNSIFVICGRRKRSNWTAM